MLDGVLVDRDPFFSLVIFKPAQPVTTTWKGVEILRLQIAFELVISRETPIRGERQEVRLDAFEIAILLQCATECGEGFV